MVQFQVLIDGLPRMNALGAIFAQVGKRGLTLLLEGDLGAGKTALTKAIAESLHCTAAHSPTFNLLNIYQADTTILHFDLYRLNCEDDLAEIGFYEYADEDGDIVIIEWPDKFPEAMPEEAIRVKIEKVGESKRNLTISLVGEKYRAIFEEVERQCQSWR